jgi:hypothetical protein
MLEGGEARQTINPLQGPAFRPLKIVAGGSGPDPNVNFPPKILKKRRIPND